MKFSTREDVEAPIESVFRAFTDFEGFEKQALRRGAEIQRNDTRGRPGLGSEWQVRFSFRGKMRDLSVRMVQFEAPQGFAAETQTNGLDGFCTLDLVALSPRRTRIQVALDLKPRNLTGRVLIQSLKFAKGSLDKRFGNRVGQMARDIESRFDTSV